MTLTFTVEGTPIPQGSLRIGTGRGRRKLYHSDSRLLPWREKIGWVAKARMKLAGFKKIKAPIAVSVTCEFYYLSPRGAKDNGNYCTTPYDIDKTLRGVLDSLTGVVYDDDVQVALATAQKVFGFPERTEIVVRRLEGP